jgi:hypothetical protein
MEGGFTSTMTSTANASLHRTTSGKPPPLADDPEPRDSSETRLLFKIEQQGQEVRILFAKKETIADAKAKVGAKLGIDPGAITLLFAGKALQDRFVIDRLRVGEQGINVYIKDDTEVLLLTGKAYRRS